MMPRRNHVFGRHGEREPSLESSLLSRFERYLSKIQRSTVARVRERESLRERARGRAREKMKGNEKRGYAGEREKEKIK
jgi:hypothetical protein